MHLFCTIERFEYAVITGYYLLARMYSYVRGIHELTYIRHSLVVEQYKTIKTVTRVLLLQLISIPLMKMRQLKQLFLKEAKPY